jgi:flagellar hook-length control protein FliK
VTNVTIPVMLSTAAKKPATSAGKKYLEPRDTNNSSFYKQLKTSQKQKNLLDKANTNTMANVSRKAQKPDEQEVKAKDEPKGKNNNQVIKQSDSVRATDSEETVNNRIEFAFCAEETSGGKGMAEEAEIILSVSEPFKQLLVPSTTLPSLPEQADDQSTNNSELVSTTKVPDDELLMFEVPGSVAEGNLPLPGNLPQTEEAQHISPDKVTKQQTDDVSSSSTMNGEQQIGESTTNIGPDQATRPDENNMSLKVSEDNMPATPPIVGIENNAGQFLKDETPKDSTRLAEEVKQEVRFTQTAHTGEKAAKDTPEVKPLVKEPLPSQSGNQKAQSESGAETKQNTERDFTASSKTSPTTDVKKLINFETHRLNASRLSSEPAPVPESQGKAVVDDGKAVLNTLSRSDTDLFRATNIADSSKNLPTTREIIAQVVQKAELLFTNKLSELKIDLKPEFLGRLTIKVMVEEGVVTARFIAENQQVKHMLESNLHTLRQNLESQGIRVERAEVSVQLNNGGMFDGSEGSRQYLWEEGQFSERHQREGPYGGNQYTGGYEELDPTVTQAGVDYGYNENGSLNFLI